MAEIMGHHDARLIRRAARNRVMKTRLAAIAAMMSALVATATMLAIEQTSAQLRAASRPATELRPVSSFGKIANRRARSIALFEEGGKVLQHPRCMNCHPATERPTQTDQMQPHQPLVVRGADGHGAPGLPCAACHHAGNFDPAGIPGHREWHLAPASMAWQGRSLAQICAQIKDRGRNGNRDLAALIHHLSEDALVGWAWSPGAGRTPAPGTQAQFGALMQAWAETRAHCPAS
jgi:hypothetical protein